MNDFNAKSAGAMSLFMSSAERCLVQGHGPNAKLIQAQQISVKIQFQW
jgi:hypothetical protein